MSYESHQQNEREVTNSLIEQSEDYQYVDKGTHKKVLNLDWGEAVTGWKNGVPYPQYVQHSVSNVIKKRTSQKPDKMPDWQRNGAEVLGAWVSDKSGIRVMREDFENHPIPSWRANIEQGTCRYVQNNGYYRTIKFLSSEDRREWYTVNKKQPEKVSMSWQNKRFQKELKRQLKREFTSYNKQFQPQESRVNHTNYTHLQDSLDRLSEPTCRSLSRSSHKSSSRRVRSTQSEIANLTPTRSSSTLNASSTIKSAPVSGTLLYKSTSDLYAENFTNRLTALEAELKSDFKIINKSDQPNHKPPMKKLYREPLPMKPRETKEVTPRAIPSSTKDTVIHSDVHDTFVIKSAVNKPTNRDLKPIEKVMHSDKMGPSGDNKKGTTGIHLKYTTMSGGDGAHLNLPATTLTSSELVLNNPLATIPNENLDKTLKSYKLAIESTKQSLIQTLTGNKIQRRTSNKGFSSPATIAVCENITNGNITSAEHRPTRSHSEQLRSVHVTERESAKRKPHVPGILPEIAGDYKNRYIFNLRKRASLDFPLVDSDFIM